MTMTHAILRFEPVDQLHVLDKWTGLDDRDPFVDRPTVLLLDRGEIRGRPTHRGVAVGFVVGCHRSSSLGCSWFQWGADHQFRSASSLSLFACPMLTRETMS